MGPGGGHVILANPPFMSPKGGIKPHNRFQVQSKRSEVLFVDYIAEHLNPNGRAAIVVPEGIIFQSQSAYCELRRMLVEGKYLAAVISLPAGVFNPYSGVKTSILILDRAAAKASDSIAFFKIENDGFGLGAQRRAVKGSQLPQVKAELAAWLASVRVGNEVELDSELGFAVDKARIAQDGEYNLSGERYRESEARASVFPLVRLDEVCELIGGSTPSKQNEAFWSDGTVKWVTCRNMGDDGMVSGFELITEAAIQQTSTRIAPAGSTILVTRVSVGKAVWADQDYAINQDLTALVAKDPNVLHPPYLFALASHLASVVDRNAEGIGVRGVTRRFVSGMEIPLPPLEVQREIVAEIEGYQKVIDGARTVLENYRPHIPIDPAWPLAAIKEIAKTITPPAKLQTSEYRESGQFPIIDQSQEFIAGWTDHADAVIDPADGLVVFGDHTCVIKYVDRPFVQGADGIKILQPIGELSAAFLAFYLQAYPLPQDGYRRHFSLLKDYKVAIPPLETQQAIVAEIEAEQALVDANRELIARFGAKIEAAIARVWGSAGTGAADEVAA